MSRKIRLAGTLALPRGASFGVLAWEEGIIMSASDDQIHEECGIFGVLGYPEAATLTYLGLYALQHRGQEGAGIVSADDGNLRRFVGLGHVSDVFPTGKRHRLEQLQGDIAIGHVRYSTFGSSTLKNVQPLAVDYARGSMALAHNGNLVNAARLREDLESRGHIFHATTDSEVFLHLIARSHKERFRDCVADALTQVIGAYSLVVTNGEELVAVRDPHGFRPLWIGRLGGSYVIASETCALDIIDADWEREVEPGEVVVITRAGLDTFKPFPPTSPAACIFEFVYVARPDSVVFGRSVDQVRKELGRNLAKASPVEADLVMAVPDSSNQVALGYAHESGLPFDMGFIRNHYVGRTFIEPDQNIRDFGVKIKLNPAREAIEGKRIVLIDDSIVRGTTSKKIIKMLRRCRVKEIHFRISCPPIVSGCYYGIDTPESAQLIASHMSVEDIRAYLEVDSLAFQTMEGLTSATGCPAEGFCLACFTGDYPTATPAEFKPKHPPRRHRDHSNEPATTD